MVRPERVNRTVAFLCFELSVLSEELSSLLELNVVPAGVLLAGLLFSAGAKPCSTSINAGFNLSIDIV